MKFCLSALLLLSFLPISISCFSADNDVIPLEFFAQLPRFSDPVLSPNGKRIAYTTIKDGQPLVAIQKLLTPDDTEREPVVPISAGGMFFNWYRWANDDRLLVNVRTTAAIRGNLLNISRMGSVDRTGKDSVFFKMTPNGHGYYRQNASVISMLENDPDHILAALDDGPGSGDWAKPEVDLVNVNTGKKQRVQKNPKGVFNWIADSDGKVRIGVAYKTSGLSNDVTIYYREGDSSDWQVLQKVNYFNHDRLVPYRFDEDDNDILLVTSDSLDDIESEELDLDLYRYDLTKREVIGEYANDYRKGILSIAKKQFPNHEVEIVSQDKAKKIYIFEIYSDVQPSDYYILDLNYKSFRFLASEYPALNNKALAVMERVSYKARDDLEIPAFLTVPEGVERKRLPVVIYPHGGPWSHDTWGFDNYVQFMASRGYAVFQPQFRGSTGFGIEHEEAGYKQWGHAIQDDITDGVNWLIEQGIADPNRICILGGSFGGYAAAMGAAKTSELYRCAVSINGVLDLKKLVRDGRWMLFRSINRVMWNKQEDIKNASPYHLAEQIGKPMLLIAGDRDTVVPYKHSKVMYERLRGLKRKVEYLELEGGEHWRTNEQHEITTLRAIEKFLDRHIGETALKLSQAELSR